jgi:energy-coupling factor transporter transmembrane protein EcfT
MKSLSLDNRKIEVLLYVVVWALVFSVPYFGERSSGHINWHEVTKNWMHILGYLAIFLINVYVFVPRLLLKKRYWSYFALVSLFIFVVIFLNIFNAPPQGDSGGDFPSIEKREKDRPSFSGKPPLMAFADNLIICILIIGAGTTFKLMAKWLNEEKLRKDIEKEHLKTNLALLRHQVSPHFFMNTLNNIHSLIEIDTEKAQDAIVRLSTLMRYLLYDAAQNTIELKKEIEFIRSFISLMQLRHSDEVVVTTVIPDQIPDLRIPPMLFISLLENAFKHGVSYPLESYIHFELRFEKTALLCIIRNSKHKIAAGYQGEYSGIGLDNIKESLKLLYENDFTLDIRDKENEFEVNLKIPLV